MKRMITAVAALLMSAATFAQTSTTTTKEGPVSAPFDKTTMQRREFSAADAGKRETERINSLVPLGAAYDKVLAINTEFVTKRKEIKADVAKDKEVSKEQSDANRTKLKALNDTHRKDLEAAMGAELYAKYQAAVKAQREERRESARKVTAPATSPAAAPAEKK